MAGGTMIINKSPPRPMIDSGVEILLANRSHVTTGSIKCIRAAWSATWVRCTKLDADLFRASYDDHKLTLADVQDILNDHESDSIAAIFKKDSLYGLSFLDVKPLVSEHIVPIAGRSIDRTVLLNGSSV